MLAILFQDQSAGEQLVGLLAGLFLMLIMAIFAAVSFALYFLPTIVAWRRRHHNLLAIALLNFSLGWTVVGWIGAAVWSFTATDPQRRLGVVVKPR